jgi:hypothetical protein
MSNRRPILSARCDPALVEQVRAEAERRFDGNEGQLVRDSVRLYLRLRERLGTAFEPTIEALTRDEERQAA